MGAIKFGTSMSRGIIAEDFPFTGVRAVSQAIGEYVLSQDARAGDRGMVIGSICLRSAFSVCASVNLACDTTRSALANCCWGL